MITSRARTGRLTAW